MTTPQQFGEYLLFRRLTSRYTSSSLPKEIPFDLDDVRASMREAIEGGMIDKEVKNLADIKYIYDARRDLPEEVEQAA